MYLYLYIYICLYIYIYIYIYDTRVDLFGKRTEGIITGQIVRGSDLEV